MNITYVRYGRKSLRVSKRWAKVLRAADKDKVGFTLTSGHRTMREQTALFRQNMRFNGVRWVQKPGRPLTAKPTPNAPHIRTGRHAHALDINALDGGETRLQKWLESKGAHPTNPVPGEAWHLEVSGQDLKRLADNLHGSQLILPARRHKLSDHGVAFIAKREGLRLEAYKPVPSDPWTIGYGHTGPDVKPGMAITKDRAERLLRGDVEWAERAVRQLVRVDISQRQFDALVSFVFNVGAGAFGSSTLLRRVNERGWWRASREFLRWNRDGSGRVLLGLSRRRRGEARMFWKHRPK